MVEAAEAAMRFLDGRARTDIETDLQLRFALTRAVEILGEAASKLSASARSEMPDVPWPAIIGMRNRLVHAYFDIDLDVLWQTVTADLPDILRRLRPYLS